MIFVTVGTQLPFDRMIQEVNKFNIKQKLTGCFAQVGIKGFKPETMDFAETLTPSQFAKHIAKCKVIVSHAGMGTILTALELGKPIVVMPRLAAKGEHRNDHQLATVENLRGRRGIHVADDEQALAAILNDITVLDGSDQFSPYAEQKLLKAVNQFINGEQQKEQCCA